MRFLSALAVVVAFALFPAILCGHSHESHCDDDGAAHECGCMCHAYFMELPAADVMIDLPLFALVQYPTSGYSLLLASSIFRPPMA